MVLSFRVLFKPAANRDIEALDNATQRRIVSHIEALAGNPRPHGARRLQGGDGQLRIRIGNYRVIYTVNDETVTVLVVRVRHRREAYR